MTGAVRVSVVVVSWNARELLAPCLRALLDQQVSSSWDYDVVLVDNASTDDTVAWCNDNVPRVRIIESDRNRGFAGGANLALRQLSGNGGVRERGPADVVVLVNNDAVARAGFVEALVSPLLQGGRRAATTGTIVLADRFSPDPNGPFRRSDGARFSPAADGLALVNSTGTQVRTDGNGEDRDWLTPVADLENRPAAAEVFGFCGGACALRLDVLREVGVFAEPFFLYYEDTDLSWRLRLAGWDIDYVPGAVVDHLHARSSVAGSEFFAFHNQRNRLLTLVRNADLPLVLTGFGRFGLGVALGRTPRRLGLRVAGAVITLLPWAVRTRTRADRTARRAVRARLVRPRGAPAAERGGSAPELSAP